MDGTVLVADDDRTIRTVLTQALTRAGCRVHATSSLTTLMRWVAEGKGDTIITDVMMPDGNGLEMLPKIASDRPGLPVIVISAQNTIMTAIETNKKDKNYKNLSENLKILKESKNEKGKKFKIIKVPMPSPIYIKNTRVPASYLNFYICNKKVLLPIFKVKEDIMAIKIFKNFFRKKKVQTIDCSKLIWGFGAIHCMTQQEPKI